MKRRLLLVQIYSNWKTRLVGIKDARNIFTRTEKFEGQKLEIFDTARYYVVPKIKYYEYRRKKIHAFEFVEKKKKNWRNIGAGWEILTICSLQTTANNFDEREAWLHRRSMMTERGPGKRYNERNRFLETSTTLKIYIALEVKRDKNQEGERRGEDPERNIGKNSLGIS